MSNIFEVQADDISLLNDYQLTKLLKQLLHLEARSAGIAQRAVEVALNINVSDGGEDGRIEWSDGPDSTSYLPSRLVQFQCKATRSLTPAKYKSEIVDAKGELQTLIEEVFDRTGAYVVFTTQKLNTKQKNRRIDAIRDVLREKEKSYAESATICIYDAASIQGWTNEHAAAITSVLNSVGKPVLPGLHTWESWQTFDENHLFDFVSDEARTSAISQINKTLSVARGTARIVGLSGLGKTRLALEVCRGKEIADSLCDRVVYIDAASQGSNLAAFISSWIQCGLEGVVVIDNCDLKTHASLCREVKRSDSLLSLLTVHYNPESDADTHQILLEPISAECIKEMLTPLFGDQIPDLDRIVSFAQGFPQMAYLLAQARIDNARDLGSLTDDALLEKLLWGGDDKDKDYEKILQGCSVFDKFGFDKEASDEAEFIAGTVVGADIDSLHACIRKYQDRGLINRAGRFAQVVPKPLAIRLAADWWRSTRRRKQQDLIESDMPGQLATSFCEQTAMLDFLPEVKDLTSDLCGHQGPFGQAEVILSVRGSRLFRALVEVNPTATSNSLYDVLSNIDFDDLTSIEGDVRRNLVWALEKLCFREDCFSNSARSLMLLAANENEDWSNNATGQFLQLFRVFLSGTSAAPEQRFSLIDEALESSRGELRALAVRALESAISTYGGSRTVGAEYQGSGEPLEEWKPRLWQEIFDYLGDSLERLAVVALAKSEQSRVAKLAIATHIRGLMQIGSDLVHKLDDVIARIVDADGQLWPEALSSIKDSLRFDSDGMPTEGIIKLKEWSVLLTPTNLGDRLMLFVSRPAYEDEEREGQGLVDVAAENACALAKELSGSLDSLVPHLEDLLKGEQRQGYWFGRNLIVEAKEWEPIFSASTRIAERTEDANLSLLYGLLNGVNTLDPEQWECLIAEFYERANLNKHYPNAITTGKIAQEHLKCLIDLLNRQMLDVNSVTILTMGRVLAHLSPQDVGSFVEELSGISSAGAWRALDILAMYCFKDDQKWGQSEHVAKKLLLKMSLTRETKRQSLEMHHWKEVAERMLRTEDADFAEELAQQIVHSSIEGIEYGDAHHYVKPVLRRLLGEYGSGVWPVISGAIIEADRTTRFRLTHLLEAENNFDRKGSSILTSVPESILTDWCNAESGSAPVFVAEAINFLAEKDDEYEVTSMGRFLIDKYGDNEDVLLALSRNISSFGWSGSVVPYYQKELAALEEFQTHGIENVRKWAERRIRYLNESIDAERIRDEEAAWGIR